MHEPMNDESLSAALRAVAAADADLGASPSVEARLLIEVRAMARARRAAHLKMYAVAAGLVLAVGTAVWTVRTVPADGPVAATPAPGGEQTTEFFALPYSSVPASGAHLVRLEVSRTALASFGLESGDSQNDAARTVLADVIVGHDGLARAIRFVWPPSDARREEQRQ
jgi:hypothetical protein